MMLTGEAGTGKTYQIKQAIIKDKRWALLTATTGIAAVNLSGSLDSQTVTTVNGALKYGDTSSLEYKFVSGGLHRILKEISAKYRRIAIEEVSMMPAEQLELITRAVVDINKLDEVQRRGGFGVVLIGDFCQLPPVKGKYAFNANCWSLYAEHILRLKKVWRQTDKEFLAGINAARRGDGKRCAELLRETSVTWNTEMKANFDGTTIMSTNAEVDKFNEVHLQKLLSSGRKQINHKSFRWGKQKGEWKNIPETLILAEGAYVMALSNDTAEYTWVNGDCGTVMGGHEGRRNIDLQLVRNGQIKTIGFVIRRVREKEAPAGFTTLEYYTKREYKEWLESEGMETPERFWSGR